MKSYVTFKVKMIKIKLNGISSASLFMEVLYLAITLTITGHSTT